MGRIRTFIAIDLPPALKRTLARFAQQLAPMATQVRWVDESLLHLTLVFLGDIEDRLAHDVCKSVARVCKQIKPIEISLVGTGVFPKPEKPRVVWAGIDEGADAIVAMREAIANDLDANGFQFDWRFQPHITLGRFGRGRFVDHALVEEALKMSEVEFGRTWIEEVVVNSSAMESGGPVYVPLATSPLDG
jgi:2'-5' RNA ligase